ncbi:MULTISPECIES: MJ0042-type zinc finger domain-containing protein [Neisseria]|uniref:MJ0042-type zinc finger domain-containing protein n=1 Tax=Neisseria TaxID=482 RepID=UPI001877BA1D|nr:MULTISPECIES: MJ0042-type zinc finger domain-containing protein [Neisseria]
MPACICPHCKTSLWVKDTQLNVAQGFVICNKCEGLFKAKDSLAPSSAPANPDTLPNAVTDVRLVHDMGGNIRNRKQLSRHEIASLLDSAERAKKAKEEAARRAEDEKRRTEEFQALMAAAAAKPAKSEEGFNWTLAVLVALTVLIMQLFYLVLL